MDRFTWLDSVPQDPSPDALGALQPPPVSFGFSSNTDLQKPPDAHHYKFANASADSIAVKHDADPELIPLSLTAQELTLEELKTYMRWYLDILARTNQRTVRMADVYQFLSNFRLSAEVKEKINRVFYKLLNLINIGEFFALLRVVSHTLEGKEPTRALIAVKASVPVPPSILSKKRQNDEYEDEAKDETAAPGPAAPAAPLDLDLFTQFMLTGERPDDRTKKRSKKLKSVKFSDQIVTDIHDVTPDLAPPSGSEPLDLLLPMDQLMSRLNALRSSLLSVPTESRAVTSPDPEEKQILAEMEPHMNYFRNLHSVDTMLVDGVPANIHLHQNSGYSLPTPPEPQLLKPNMTGPAQMAQMTEGDNLLPLRPNVTGPADMARYFSPSNDTPAVSLQSFTSQMTGDTANNTILNSRLGHEEKQLPPPPVPATRRARSHSQPSPAHIMWPNGDSLGNGDTHEQPSTQLPVPVIADPSGTDLLSISHRFRSSSASPAPPIPPRSPLGSARPGPPPPPRRRGGSVASSPVPQAQHNIDQVINVPPPLPAKIPNTPMYQNADSSSSTANILDDLKALQEEVDKIRDMTGGF